MPESVTIETFFAFSVILVLARWSWPPSNRLIHSSISHWVYGQKRAPRYIITIAMAFVCHQLIAHYFSAWTAMAAAATATALFFNGYADSGQSFWSRRRNRFLGFLFLCAFWAYFFVDPRGIELYYLALSATVFRRSIKDKNEFIEANIQDIEALRQKVSSSNPFPPPPKADNQLNSFAKTDAAS